MHVGKTIWTLSVWLWLGCLIASAQTDSLLRQADRLLNYKAYGRAIDAYTQILNDSTEELTDEQRATVQAQLAFAYQQVGDAPKAERFYRESLGNSAGENPQRTLQYAQSLATNGKFQEAQQQYDRYLQLKEKLPSRRAEPVRAIPDARVANRKEATRYRLDYLALNTPGEEFSPTFYQDGLVYVSGRKGSATIETTGSGGGNSYLDLLYVPNRNSLKVSSVINADGSVGKPVNEQVRPERRLGADEYSRPTANDSRTVPSFDASINISQGLGYDARPVNPAQQFSKTLNTRYHEGPATFSRDGSQIIFTRNNYNGGRAGKSADGVTKLKLYTARQQNGGWTPAEELPFNSNEYSVGHPTLSRDGQLLYFVSDMPGGFGGTDLYVSRYQDGQWGRPINLGNTLNTSGNEQFPFVDDAGNLYFASDGRRGLGALDIYYAALTNGLTVQRIEHLEAPINSPQDDFGLITDVNREGGYFSSNRRDGNDDIYRFVRESSLYGCRDLTVRLYDSNTDLPLDSATVVVKTRGEGRPDQSLTTDRNGFLRLCLEGDNDFMFQASHDGYVSNQVGFTTRYQTDDQPTRLEIPLVRPTALIDTIAANQTGSPASADGLPAPSRSRIRGIVLSQSTRRPVQGVTVRLRSECDNKQYEFVTGSDGRYYFDLVEGCDYTLVASKPTFGTNANKVKSLPKRAKPNDVAADLRMLSIGDVVKIDNIYYDLDQHTLRPDATRELDKLVATMRKYPSLIIEIRSHTDSRGEAAYNKALSTQRAKAVATYLTSRGISRRRISTLGMGETQLVNDCTDGVICTEEEHQRNRRTEFRVLDIR